MHRQEKKIARAFVEGKQITLEGGKVYFDSDWYHCLDCGCYFNHPEMHLPVSHCPLCGHQGFTRAIPDSLVETTEDSAGDYCICPGCGKEIEHIPGIPFNAEYCPDCQTRMRRKGNPS
jgi:DNA-directed RNA polymerase subunit RPC12/RpoP